jgi:S1-C subfamily serine protease
MIPNRSRLRVVPFAFLAVCLLVVPVLVPAMAQTSVEDSLTDSIGKIFRGVIGEKEEQAAPRSEAAPANEIRREPPRSRADMMMSFSPLVKATAPAVVNVYADRMVQRRSSLPFAGDPFFEQFFGQRIPNRTERQSLAGFRRHCRGAWHCGHQQSCHRRSG